MTDPRIEAALERAVELGEIGVQVAAWHGDELVVDAWIGTVDETSGTPVDHSTLFPVFSVSKAFMATVVHLLAERGQLDIDDPVAKHWPEYGTKGKDAITIRHVLTHRAGVPQAPPWLTPERLADWDEIVAWLADTEPMAPPGERSLYHSLTFGYLLGEVVRRADPEHRFMGDIFRQDIAARIGIEDVWFGLPEAEEHRVARLTWGPGPRSAPSVAPNPVRTAMMPAAVAAEPDPSNTREAHANRNPALTGIMTARDGARFFALLANRGELGGVRILSEQRLLDQTEPRPRAEEVDGGIGMATANGVGGYWVGSAPYADPTIGRGAHVLGHGGAGGASGWADLDARVGVLINHNRMFGAVTPETHPLVPIADAIREVTR